MTDTFIFANTEAGRAQRTHVANVFNLAGRTVREFEEDFTTGNMTTHLLKLEVGKRVDEGKIAADMRERAEMKARKQ